MPAGNPRWQPGVSGNPEGTAKIKLFRKALRDVLSYEEAKEIAKAVVKKAKAGDLFAVNLIADRLDGKPKQEIDINDERRSDNLASRFEQILSDAASRADASRSAGGQGGTGRVN